MLNDFLHALFGSYLEKYNGFIELRAINEKIERHFVTSVDEFIDKVSHLQGNIYFGICPRETSKDGTKENIKFIIALWVDIDIGSEGHKKQSKYKDNEEALEALRTFELQPSIIIDSGHGLQCYWLLKAVEEIKDVGFVEGIMKGISTYLGGDYTQDISRVFRVPETTNIKIPNKPKQVKIIRFDKDRRYEINDFKDYYIPALRSSKVEVNFEQVLPKIDLERMKVSGKIKKLITSRDNEPYPSRSEKDQAVVLALVKADYSDTEIKAIFSNPGYGISQKYLEKGKYGDNYLALSIQKAKARLEDNRISSMKDNILLEEPPLPLLEFLNQDIPPVEYYVENLLMKQGKTIISANANVGKSIFAQNLALALTTGQTKFLNKFNVTRARVLYLDLEMGNSLLKARFQMMITKDSLEAYDLYVKHLSYFDFLDETYPKKLEEWIFDFKINVLIIDPIGGALFGDENKKEDVGKLTTYLNTLIDRHKISVLLVHHWRKATEKFRSGGEMAAGSYKWSAWTDHHITIEGLSSSLTVSCQKSRSSTKFKPFLIKLNEETLKFEFLADYEKKITDETLLNLFKSFNKPKVSVPDMIERAKEKKIASKATVRKLLKESKTLGVDDSEKTHYVYELGKMPETDKENLFNDAQTC